MNTEAKSQIILVVEDDPVEQALLLTMLRNAGYSVLCANDGKEAVELAKSPFVCLILMDLQLPGTDGFTASQAIRSWELENGLTRKILAVTACVSEEYKAKCYDIGIDSFIAKPYSRRELLQRIVESLDGEEL